MKKLTPEENKDMREKIKSEQDRIIEQHKQRAQSLGSRLGNALRPVALFVLSFLFVVCIILLFCVYAHFNIKVIIGMAIISFLIFGLAPLFSRKLKDEREDTQDSP